MKACLLVLAGGCLVWAGDNSVELMRKDRERLQGDWKVVQAVSKGVVVPKEELEDLHLIFKDDLIQVREGDKVNDKFNFKIDPTKKPKEIDFTFSDGPKKGRTDKAIYLLDGDDLKFCIQEAKDGARPTDFVSKTGAEVSLVVLKRSKK